MQKHVVIVGVGRFGSVIAKELSDEGHEVLAIDQDNQRVKQISSEVTYAVQANFTDTKSLKTLGINEFDIGIIGIGKNLYDNLAASYILKKFNVPYIIAKADNKLHGELLKELGVDKVVYPEKTVGSKVAQDIYKDD
mgnify:CR=1 FL=1